MTLLVVLLTLVVALQTVLVVGLLRSHADILRRLHELGAGVERGSVASADRFRAPAAARSSITTTSPGTRTGADITGFTPDGETVGIRVVGTGHDTVIAFLSSGCETCRPFWEAFSRPGDLALRPETRLVIVTQDADAETPAAVARLAPRVFAVVMSSEAWTAYDVPGAPFVVLVDGASGRVRGSGTGASWAEVADLLQIAAAEATLARQAPGWRAAADRDRERDVDQVLLTAGIRPGDPSLYLSAEGQTVAETGR